MTLIPALQNPHTHIREGEVVKPLIELALQGGVDMLGPMPNTIKGLLTAEQTLSYNKNARGKAPRGSGLRIIPIVQFTESTTPTMIDDCGKNDILDAKIYPRNRTTKSQNGVERYARIIPIVQHAAEWKIRSHFHPEHPSPLFDNRDAEFAFLPIIEMLLQETTATIVWEHGTDARCIPHWMKFAETGRFFVTTTAHHLVENESGTYGDVAAACKPPYKTEQDRRGLINLIKQNFSWVMAGGDDAPHPKGAKHVVGNCACGAYTAPFLLPLYAHALWDIIDPDTFVNFTSKNASRLYNTHSTRQYRVVEKPFKIPLIYTAGPWEIEPFWAGRELNYSII